MGKRGSCRGGGGGGYLEEDFPDFLLSEHLHAISLALLLGNDERVDVEAAAIRGQAAPEQPNRLDVSRSVADAQPEQQVPQAITAAHPKRG